MAQFIPMVVSAFSGGGAAAGTAAAGTTAATTAATTTAATSAGMSTAAKIALVASTAATGLSAYSQLQAGKAAGLEADQLRQVEKIKAGEAAVSRRERLIQALAQQNAKVGASGIGQGGTPQQVKLQDIDQFEREDMAQSTMDQIRQKNLKAAAKNSRRSGKIGAGVSLLKGAGDAYTIYGK